MTACHKCPMVITYSCNSVKTRSPSDKEEPSNELVTSGTAYHGRKHVLNVKQNYLPEYDCDITNDIDYKVLNIDVRSHKICYLFR